MAAAVNNAILGVARWLDIAHDRARQLVRDRTVAGQLPTPVNGNLGWVGLHDLGAGGYGICALFGRFDPHGILQERMVVKETWCTGTTWYDPVQWQGPYNANGHRDYCAGIQHVDHMENALLRRLDSKNPETIVKFVGSSLPNPIRWNFRTYLEYCPHGTLEEVIDFYSDDYNFDNDDSDPDGDESPSEEEEIEDHTMDDDDGDAVRDRGLVRRRRVIGLVIPGLTPQEADSEEQSSTSSDADEDDESTPDESPEAHHLIPEPFLWYTFDCLVRAAQVMQNGHDKQRPTPEDRTAARDWRHIVHRDIKPENVFLVEPPPGPRDHWKLYPKPVLADFGLGIETTPDDPNNPRAYREMGTYGYLTPEQRVWVHRTNRNFFDNLKVGDMNVFRLDSHTNVWQIGMVMYCLVHRIKTSELKQVAYVSNADIGDSSDTTLPRRRGRRRAQDEDTDMEQGTPRREPWRVEVPAPGYSSTLIELVHDCLSMDPTKRPSLEQIRATITPSMGLDPDTDHFKGMRRMKPMDGQSWYNNDRGRDHRLRKGFRDEYRTGLSYNQLPAR